MVYCCWEGVCNVATSTYTMVTSTAEADQEEGGGEKWYHDEYRCLMVFTMHDRFIIIVMAWSLLLMYFLLM